MPLAHELLGEIEIARSDIPQAIKEFQSEQDVDLLHGQSTHGWAMLISAMGVSKQARKSLNRALLSRSERDLNYTSCLGKC